MRRCSLVTTWRVLRGRQSELIRHSDRINAGVQLSLGPLLAVLAAVAALVALSVLHTGQVKEQIQRHTMHRVESTVLQVHDLTTAGPTDPSTTPAWEVQVQWRTATGALRQASMVTLHQHEPGGRMPLWVNGRGMSAPVQWRARDSAATAAFAGLSVFSFGWLLLAAGAAMARRMVTRRQLADWTVEWERVGQTWTSR